MFSFPFQVVPWSGCVNEATSGQQVAGLYPVYINNKAFEPKRSSTRERASLKMTYATP